MTATWPDGPPSSSPTSSDLAPFASSSFARGAAGVPAALAGASRLVWDFDGVVFDTEPAHHASFEALLRSYDVDLREDWFAVGVSEPDRWRDWVATYGAESRLGEKSIDDLIAERAVGFAEHSAALRPNWFVTQLLALPAQHWVCSAGNHSQIVELLDQGGIAGAFDRVLAVGSPGVPAGQGKPERVASAAVPGAFVLEDAPAYIEHAHQLGLRTLGVQHGYNDLTAVPTTHRVHAHVVDVWV